METFTRYGLIRYIWFSKKCTELAINVVVTNKKFMYNTYVKQGDYYGREIAVKLLHVDTVQGLDDQQYINEVGNLLMVKHPNIVQLLGYCYEIQNELIEHNGANHFTRHVYRFLFFEYLQGGSLDKHLHGMRT